ncbi:uncharacterized protein [Narcine bancroftii]|uniref:uncharacterized protein isoform X4 n=1 Tax=Narcine bancroftii TaxID=1343680 RepID=UPI0038312897
MTPLFERKLFFLGTKSFLPPGEGCLCPFGSGAGVSRCRSALGQRALWETVARKSEIIRHIKDVHQGLNVYKKAMIKNWVKWKEKSQQTHQPKQFQ